MKVFLFVFAILCVFTPRVFAAQDPALMNAFEAFSKNKKGDFLKWQKEAQTPELARYLEEWQLRLFTLDSNPHDPEILAFLKRYENSVVSERLQRDWVNALARKNAWMSVFVEFPKIAEPTAENRCAFELAKTQMGDFSLLENNKQMKHLWFKNQSPQALCQDLMTAIFETHKISANEVIAKARLQVESGRFTAARKTLLFLKPEKKLEKDFLEDDIKRAIKDSLRFLAKLPKKWEKNDIQRHLASLALARYAAKSVDQALIQFSKIEKKFKPEEAAWVWSQMAIYAAREHKFEALEYFKKAEKHSKLSPYALEWYARIALRYQKWKLLAQIIQKMPKDLKEQSVWTYWLGRSLAAQGKIEESQQQYKKIAHDFHYYANLAREELGQTVTIPKSAAPPTKAEMAFVKNHAGLKRAFLLFENEMRLPAIQEWNWAINRFNDRQKLAAAYLAKENEVWDRAVNTAILLKREHQFELRFLAPFSEIIRPAAEEQQLDPAWVYGLMRQESRFITDAKSHAGASGLMQLMPKTAKWVAKKIGLKDYKHAQVYDHDINVLLGTTYMRLVLDDLDNSPLLASAAYNAGPSRAKRWRHSQIMEGAIYAETIPFDETRNYVQKVLNNAVYYSILFNQKSDSLKRRLGVVVPQAVQTSTLP